VPAAQAMTDGDVRTLVGGVGELYQGDFDFGRRAFERLSREDLGAGVIVEELSYGAVAVVHRLRELRPDALIVVGAADRARLPGTVERRRIGDLALPIDELQIAVWESSTGFVSIDLLLAVCHGFDALPRHTVAIEVEPAKAGPSETMSPEAEAGLEEALELVRSELEALGRAVPPALAGRGAEAARERGHGRPSQARARRP
jgi:hydrogenase maturation protease